MCISEEVIIVLLWSIVIWFPLNDHIISGSGTATNRTSNSTFEPTGATFAFGFLENVGGIPSKISARDDSLKYKISTLLFHKWRLRYLRAYIFYKYYLDKLLRDKPPVSDPWSESGVSTTSSVVLEANPAAFFATHVNVPASSGNTSLIIKVATLSSS